MQQHNLLEDLEQDILELASLLEKATRPNVKSLLKSELDKLSSLLTLEKDKQEKKKNAESKKESAEGAESEIKYTSVSNYSWEQGDQIVKIFLQLDDIGDVPKENIHCDFGNQSVEVKIKGYKNQNLRFCLKKLNDLVNVEECKCIHKKNSLHLQLAKKVLKNWDTIYYKESALKTEKEPKVDKEDPQASLMNMMKKLYQEGDDEMKKTIAQAWTKSQDEKDKKK